MLKMNKKLEYGVIALIHLASKETGVASVREISGAYGVPETLLSKVMQCLKAQGMVLSLHGHHGGYRLNRPLSQINLLELTQALVGPVVVVECLTPGNVHCPAQTNCTIVTPMGKLNQRIISLFQQTSIDSLVSEKKVAL